MVPAYIQEKLAVLMVLFFAILYNVKIGIGVEHLFSTACLSVQSWKMKSGLMLGIL